jgi:serine/threonine protein kinase/tetratricopeptide (TPR) repeat protein
MSPFACRSRIGSWNGNSEFLIGTDVNLEDSAYTIFNNALELSDAAARALYLNEACGIDAALRERLEKLLQAHDEAGGFFSQPLKPTPIESTAVTAPVTMEKVGAVIGRYKLLEQIGEGGCGVVYMAEQQEPVRRRVALKVIKLGMDTKQVVARFEAERQALALMDHPNIAKVLDAGATDTGRPYFVMELVRGIRITEFCDQKKLSTQERLELFISVCRAIQHAHQKGIIHRDLKPSNVLVTTVDGAPVPKVIDFGIAKATSNQPLTDKTLFTAFAQFIGTPAYMSPEQAEMSGVDIDTRSDIYSLGIVLYELLTGKTPFDAKALLRGSIDEIRSTIREQEPPKPSTRLHALSQADLTTTAEARHLDGHKLIQIVKGDLDWIVMKCLEKERSRRYETVNGLAADVLHHLNTEPVVARPPSRWYEFQKTVRRHKLAFAATAAIIVVLAAGVVTSTWQAVRATRAEREQNRLRGEAVAARNNEAKLRTEAETNAKKAQTEALKSAQVARFLKEMLMGAESSVALGRDTRLLREILDKTAARIGKDLANQPEVQAELCVTLGYTYFELGEWAKSEAMQRKALGIFRKLLGNENRKVAITMNDVAINLCQERKWTEAESMYREALAIYSKISGAESLDVTWPLNNLGNVLGDAGRPAEAEPLHREALRIRRKLLGNDTNLVALVLYDLGRTLKRSGKATEAEVSFRESLSIYRKQGETNRYFVNAFNGLADLLREQGNVTEAEGLYREALAMQRKLWGDEHPHVAQSLHTLADVLRQGGKLNQAEALYREALAIRRKTQSSEHPRVAAEIKALAEVLDAQGKSAEANALKRAR